MPISNQLKKMIVFSNEKTKQMIETIIADEANATRLSGSALIEDHILNDILPTNKIGRDLFQDLYSGKPIKDILSALFNMNAAGTNFECRWEPDTMRPFVEYAMDLMVKNHFRNRGGTYNREKNPYLLSQLKTLVHILREADETNRAANLHNTISFFEDYIGLTDENVEEIRMSSYLQMIQDNWDILSKSTYTYRALYGILEVEYDWETYPEERYQLGQLIKENSMSWD